VKDILILNSTKCILLNTYLNKIFLRTIFSEEFQKDYLKDLDEQLDEQRKQEIQPIKKKFRRTLSEFDFK